MKRIESSAVIFASVAAVIASFVGALALIEIRKQNTNAARQLEFVEEQSQMLVRQVKNDNIVTFLQLLEAMLPQWHTDTDEDPTILGIGGADGFERYESETYIVRAAIYNDGKLPLIVSRRSTVSVNSCITGMRVNISQDSDLDAELARSKISERTVTILPGENRSIDFFKDSLDAPIMAEALNTNGTQYMLTFRALVYSMGAEIASGYLGDLDGLDNYIRSIQVGDDSIPTPFLSDQIIFTAWVSNSNGTISFTTTDQNCSSKQVDARFLRSTQ